MFSQSEKLNEMTLALLDGYLSGTLPESMKAWLDERMALEPELRREVEAQRLTIAALRDRGRRDDAQLAQAMQHITRGDLEQLLTSLRGTDAGSTDAACQCPAATKLPPAATPAAASKPTPPAASTTPSAVKQRHKASRVLWNTLAMAAMVCGVWFGARIFYRNQAAQDTADTYIAVNQTATAPALGAARGVDEPMAAPDWETDTVHLADAAPQYTEAELIMMQAKHLLQNGLYNEAIALLEPLYRESDAQRDVALLLATAYVKASERDKAHDVLQALEKRYSGDPEIEALSKAYFD